MNATGIQSFCIAGTDAYLAYLVANNRGLDKIRVIQKQSLGQLTKPAFKLVLASRLFDLDSIALELTPPGEQYGPDYFRVVEYDGDAKTLIIEVLNSQLDLNARHASDLLVVSDLRFLVKNVRQWYASNGLKLRLPQGSHPMSTATLTPQEQQVAVQLETCQQNAVAQSLKNPLTYVWGPPGTGKTKHVLTQGVLTLLSFQKQVGVFAPTNNALDQAMAAIINAAEAAGIDRGKFLRVGHPSTKFANSFPEVCEVHGLQKKISELANQIKNYRAVLEYRRGASVLNSVETLRHEIASLQESLRERRRVYEELARLNNSVLSKAVHFFDGKLQTLKDSLDPLETKINGNLMMIKLKRTPSQSLNAILNRIDFTNVTQIEQEASNLQETTRQYMAVSRALADEYQGQSNDELQYLITDLEKQLRVIEAQTVEARIKAALVVGMTLDCFIGRFHDTLLPFDHIFLDEAGYAPLVKALTLCRREIPLTFIGDHMQLGPVCEMDDGNMNEMVNNTAIVWKKSALFLDDPFTAVGQDALQNQLFQQSRPRLGSFACANLNMTFRFGQNLADVLSRNVYEEFELVSAEGNRNIEIICLDSVPTGPPNVQRQSRAEAEAIASYVGAQLSSDADCEEAYAILTPYKNQVRLLNQLLVQPRQQGRIMTIHKSQGREWDTVIISIADGRYNRPWFTDTTNNQAGGIHIMNTAISRARKRLVIACDASYWARHPNQLVSLLLNLAN